MNENDVPADWAIEKALKLRVFNDGICLSDVKSDPARFRTITAFAIYIEAHEEPPISRELLCARESMALGNEYHRKEIERGLWDHSPNIKWRVGAIQLYASGFGETDG